MEKRSILEILLSKHYFSWQTIFDSHQSNLLRFSPLEHMLELKHQLTLFDDRQFDSVLI